MKKILALFVIVLCTSSLVPAFDVSNCEEKMFTVTSYYSPVSGQSFYYKSGFQEEVILNGQWYYWASGKKVFNGMLAGPSSYVFWSKIFFQWLGVGEIADRGGAIVLSWERWQNYDRIDIRMWRGEEWLVRALTFGKKNLTGYYCDAISKKNMPKDNSLWSTTPVYKHFFDIALRIQQLEAWRSDIRTWTLQKYLVKLWYLDKKYRNWMFELHTKKALCKYQVAKKMVSATNADCWIFGSRTRYAMKLDVQSKRLLPTNLYAIGKIADLIEFAKYYNGKPTESPHDRGENERGVVETTTTKVFLFYRSYTKGQQSSEIKILQTFLQAQWIYTSSIDGIYSKKTMDAIYEFQKRYWLISDNDSLSLRGFLWPKTRSKINELRNK